MNTLSVDWRHQPDTHTSRHSATPPFLRRREPPPRASTPNGRNHLSL